MNRKKLPPVRNKLDLADPRQARLVRKRLKLSEIELTQIVEKAGNSIAAISKQAALQLSKEAARQRVKRPAPAQVPPAVIVSATAGETAVPELPIQGEPAA